MRLFLFTTFHENLDAQENWCSKNVFNAVMMGGRSLRISYELIYGIGVMQQPDPEHTSGWRITFFSFS